MIAVFRHNQGVWTYTKTDSDSTGSCVSSALPARVAALLAGGYTVVIEPTRVLAHYEDKREA